MRCVVGEGGGCCFFSHLHSWPGYVIDCARCNRPYPYLCRQRVCKTPNLPPNLYTKCLQIRARSSTDWGACIFLLRFLAASRIWIIITSYCGAIEVYLYNNNIKQITRRHFRDAVATAQPTKVIDWLWGPFGGMIVGLLSTIECNRLFWRLDVHVEAWQYVSSIS